MRVTDPVRLQHEAQTLLRNGYGDNPAGAVEALVGEGAEPERATEAVARAVENLDEQARRAAEKTRNTEAGNAERLVEAYGGQLRYVFEQKQWLSWDGTRWKPDGGLRVEQCAKALPKQLYADAACTEDPGERDRLGKWARQSERASTITAAIKLARSDLRIVVAPDDLDADPWALNVENGTVDLRTGELRPHDPAEMHSKVAAASYRPNAEAPRWEEFLAEVLPDEEVRDYVQRLVGYSLTGEIGENVLPFPYGEGANGKSVCLGTLREVLGDYATEAAPDLLVQRWGDRGVPTDIADLRGYRFVTTTEVEGGKPMATEVMKRITGERKLKARRMRQDFEEFTNVTKLWMAANDRPPVDGLDEAIWRRIRLIPFTVTIPAEDRDPDLTRKLLEERDGILAWAVEGCLAYGREGLANVPSAVRAETESYRNDSNPLADWAEAECELQGDASESNVALRESYERYCRHVRVKAIPPRSGKWSEGLRRLGCSDDRTESGKVWHSIRLRRPEGAAF